MSVCQPAPHETLWRVCAHSVTGPALQALLADGDGVDDWFTWSMAHGFDSAHAIAPAGWGRVHRLPIYGERPIDRAARDLRSDERFGAWLVSQHGGSDLVFHLDCRIDPSDITIDEAGDVLQETHEACTADDNLFEEFVSTSRRWLLRELRKQSLDVEERTLDHRCHIEFTPIDPPETPGVYCIQGVPGFVKIGKALRSIRARIREIQCAHPVPVQLLAILSNDPGNEGKFHKALSAARAHGEWFRLTPEVLRVIAEARAAA